MDKMLSEFYALRGFDPDGVPQKAVLEKIGLPDLAALLHDGKS
jgi:aldehyde:ferredoxin oxidoreductase